MADIRPGDDLLRFSNEMPLFCNGDPDMMFYPVSASDYTYTR